MRGFGDVKQLFKQENNWYNISVSLKNVELMPQITQYGILS